MPAFEGGGRRSIRLRQEKCATLIKEAQALIAGLKTEIAELGTQLG
jgi:hypothetical protein